MLALQWWPVARLGEAHHANVGKGRSAGFSALDRLTVERSRCLATGRLRAAPVGPGGLRLRVPDDLGHKRARTGDFTDVIWSDDR
ncbi:MAG: hypothetical protein ACRDT2_12815 [Natronosporangium sp.]